MTESNIKTFENNKKATGRYETVDSPGRQGLADKRVHFIGTGGVGMSGLAKLLLNNNAVVTGSDQTASDATRVLGRL